MSDSSTTPAMASILVTVDHVYLPVAETADGNFEWTVSNVSTVRVPRGARLDVPVDFALFLADRKQAEVLS